ncbi:MAG TPA: diaminopimelate epimerase [Thermoanaerobaculia bacterium]|nr:diaminopimelate epimerase [Thermoanaerobaculia bacterium]
MPKTFPGLLRRLEEAPTFFKMAGAGNDFIVIDNRSSDIENASELAQRLCMRRLSIGADGLILVENSARATFRMRYLNADGSQAFCANGTRCAARFAFLNVIAPRRMTIETDAGIVGAEVHEQEVTLTLPDPRDARLLHPLNVGETTVRGSYIRVGVPHYVVFLRDDLWSHDIVPLGRGIRSHAELQPEGANADFVVVRDRSSLEVRTYERGVEDETLACGSGVVASVAVAALFGRIDSPVSVLTRGGIRLHVSFDRGGAAGAGAITEVRLRGDARVVFKSELTPETLEGFDPRWVRNPTKEGPAS